MSLYSGIPSNRNSMYYIRLPTSATRIRSGYSFILLTNQSFQMLLLGLCLGITIGIFILTGPQTCNNDSKILYTKPSLLSLPEQKSTVTINIPKRRNVENVLYKYNASSRPKYASTELGIKNCKVLVGIIISNLSSPENIVMINQTIGRFIDNQLLIFVKPVDSESSQNFQNLLTKHYGFNAQRIVGLPGSNSNSTEQDDELTHKIIEHFYKLSLINGQEYLYYYIGLDTYYVNGGQLYKKLSEISVSQDFVWGIPKTHVGRKKALFCALDSGFVLTQSVVELYGQCTSLTNCINLNPSYNCDRSVQGLEYTSTKSWVGENYDRLRLTELITIGPILESSKLQQLHFTVSKYQLKELNEYIKIVQERIQSSIPKVPKKNVYEFSSWPIGLQPANIPKSRWDVNIWTFFSPSNSMYLKNEFEVNGSSELDKLDFENVKTHAENHLSQELSPVNNEYGDKSYFEFLYGYRRYESLRGMEYLLDFRDVKSGVLYRVEALRPVLKKIEIVPVPFVKENARITIILPITCTKSLDATHQFLKHWFERHSKNSNTILFLVVPTLNFPTTAGNHQSSNSTFLTPDQILQVKSIVSHYNENTTNGTGMNSRVGYGIIHLKPHIGAREFRIFGILDHLYKRVFSSASLILLLDPLGRILKNDFLNHARLNTILNQQIFSPVPFIRYENRFLKLTRKIPTSPNLSDEVNKRTGYFNTRENRAISFYYGDYYRARKIINLSSLSKSISDWGIVDDFSMVLDLFLLGSNLHVLRSVEPNLHFPAQVESSKSKWIAPQADLAKIIFSIPNFVNVYNKDDNINKFY